MARNAGKALIAAIQLTCTNDKVANFERAASLVEQCVSRGASMVFLPECADYIAKDSAETIAIAEPIDGPFMTKYSSLAKRLGVWLSLGIHRSVNNGDCITVEKPFNSHVVLDANGKIRAIYDKIHLFHSSLANASESSAISGGSELVPPVDTPVGRVGLAVCFDLRFPELAAKLARKGAEILTFPSAFHPVTGAAHWETLLRARAIENQVYVVGAAQTGKHTDTRSSYGHTMIVDPWGTVIAQCGSQVSDCFCLAEIDHDYLTKVRQMIPLHPAVQEATPWKECFDDSHSTIDFSYNFGDHVIHGDNVFYQTHLTFAFVNLRPIVPGHLLVSPVRKVERMKDLSPAESADLWSVVKKVSIAAEKIWNASSLNVAVQDGPFAGQSVPHVHVHILPRRKGDFKRNDAVYEALESHSCAPDVVTEVSESSKPVFDPEKRRDRSFEEMTLEAQMLREYFGKNP